MKRFMFACVALCGLLFANEVSAGSRFFVVSGQGATIVASGGSRLFLGGGRQTVVVKQGRGLLRQPSAIVVKNGRGRATTIIQSGLGGRTFIRTR